MSFVVYISMYCMCICLYDILSVFFLDIKKSAPLPTIHLCRGLVSSARAHSYTRPVTASSMRSW
ncbi:hypothetical protein HBH68_225860 [Parastagonospora nodorum]|nr:hypothetical protein HBH96_240160 [Parastagonospora nodorum]KAH5168850.1 hypothetical protein HBH68_225860 [Parastagonospora nodorum]KAH5179279.1 hypothetical protein HBH76_182430 [Parastagonospora nodorum]